MPVITKAQVLATLGEFGDWDEVSGGHLEGQVQDYYPAGARTPTKLEGTHAWTNLTLSRAFDPARDMLVLDWAKNAVRTGKDNTRTVLIKFLNQIGVPIRQRTLGPCKIINFAPPDGKSGDNSPAMISLTLAVTDSP